MLKLVKLLASDVLEALDTPVSLGVYLRIKHGEFASIAQMHVDPLHYIDTSLGALKFAKDVQSTSFLRKYPGLYKGGAAKRQTAAFEAFWESEVQCYTTNLRLSNLLSRPRPEEARILVALEKARVWITRVLGRCPDASQLEGAFGPGTAFELKGIDQVCLADKINHSPTYTGDVYSAVIPVLETKWGSLEDFETRLQHVPGNRFATVAKDATKDRGICVEPGCNIFSQLGVGAVLRRRLRRVGIDLDHNADKHRLLAMQASYDNRSATIDLSNASDTVAYCLVQALLPDEWFALLDGLRSPMTLLQKKQGEQRWVQLEKFSSMGNGFTFELETLIFASLAHAMGGKVGCDTWVYGDDIIAPSSIARDLCACLRYFGFTPNAKKTYATGPFRESCGGDFFLGHYVRPYFLKLKERALNGSRSWIGLIRIYNGLRTFFTAINKGCSFLDKYLEMIPSRRRLWGPHVLGDAVLQTTDIQLWTIQIKHSIRMVKGNYFASKRKSISKYPPEVQLAVILWGATPLEHDRRDEDQVEPDDIGSPTCGYRNTGIYGIVRRPRWYCYS